MTFDSQNLDSFVPVYSVSPEKPEDLRNFTTEQLRIHATGINFREIGFYLDKETITGKSFIPGVSSPNDQTFRTVFRKVINCSPLIVGTNTFPHGITFDANFTLVHLYVGATQASSYAEQIPNGSDTVTMDATNIIITVTMPYNRAYATIEYLLEQ